MGRMALAAQIGGAVGIRANTPEDIRAIRAAVSLPIIGLFKDLPTRLRCLHHPHPDARAARLPKPGRTSSASMPPSVRARKALPLAEFIRRIKAETGCPMLADISTLEEAVLAEESGRGPGRLDPLRLHPLQPADPRPRPEAGVRDGRSGLSIPAWPKGATPARNRWWRPCAWGRTPSSSAGPSPDRLKSPPILFRRWKTWIHRTQIHSLRNAGSWRARSKSGNRSH